MRRRRVLVLGSLLGFGLFAAPFLPSKTAATALPDPSVASKGSPSARVPVPVRKAGGEGAQAVWVDPTETTVKSFKECVQAGACSTDHLVIPADVPCNYDAPDRGDHPMNCVDWYGAEQYCKWTGGRLCEDEEWFAACRGPDDTDYPYGQAFDASACISSSRTTGEPRTGTSPVGATPGCMGGYSGLSDMVGNVSEWVNTCKGTYCKFYGGGFLNNDPISDFASCKHFCAGNQKDFKSATIGIRCCHDAGGT